MKTAVGELQVALEQICLQLSRGGISCQHGYLQGHIGQHRTRSNLRQSAAALPVRILDTGMMSNACARCTFDGGWHNQLCNLLNGTYHFAYWQMQHWLHCRTCTTVKTSVKTASSAQDDIQMSATSIDMIRMKRHFSAWCCIDSSCRHD